MAQKKGAAWLHGIFPGLFDPQFEAAARQLAHERCASRTDDPWLLGWFTDNELRWGPDWRGQDELLTMFLALPANARGTKRRSSYSENQYHDVAKFNFVWHTAFASWDALAQRARSRHPWCAKRCTPRTRKRSGTPTKPTRSAPALWRTAMPSWPNWRNATSASPAKPSRRRIRTIEFGCRFAYVPPKPVVVAAAKYLDAISFNCYATNPRPVINQYAVFGKPLIIGEFSFRGDDSGLPNTKGAGPRVKTQADRAADFRNYVTWALGNPNVVGYHWFEHADEPKEGRFDGENSNYGVVNIKDEVYQELTGDACRSIARRKPCTAKSRDTLVGRHAGRGCAAIFPSPGVDVTSVDVRLSNPAAICFGLNRSRIVGWRSCLPGHLHGRVRAAARHTVIVGVESCGGEPWRPGVTTVIDVPNLGADLGRGSPDAD